MNKQELYNKMPIFIQNMAISAEGMRLAKLRWGEFFQKRLEFYRESDKWSEDQIAEYQNTKLKELCIHAYETVPFYKREFDEYGFDPYAFKDRDELRKLPVLTKEVVQENYRDFISTAKLDSKTHIIRTGGSTGKSMLIYETWNEQADWWAICWRHREKIGIPFGTWGGELCSKLVVPQSQKKAPYSRVDYGEHRVFFSPYHLNETTIEEYASELRRVRWLHGYTSKLVYLANELQEKGIELPMDYVTVAAEKLYESNKAMLERVFRCKVYQLYGLTERAANISQQPDGSMRIDEDFSFVEFEKNDRGLGIIGTNFLRKRMPLIRYKTGDYAKFSGRCNGGYRIIDSLEGREFEYLIRENGTAITAVEIDEEIIKHVEHIAEAQVYQKKNKQVEFRVHKGVGYSLKDEQLLRRKIEEVFNGDKIKIVYVDNIENENNGKRKMLLKE